MPALLDHLERHPQHRATADGHRGEGDQAQLAASLARVRNEGGDLALEIALEPAQEDEVGAHDMRAPIGGQREGARVHRDDDRHPLCDEGRPRIDAHRQSELAAHLEEADGCPMTRAEERGDEGLETLLDQQHERLRLEEPRVGGRVARRDDTRLSAIVDHGHRADFGTEQPDAWGCEGADEQVDGLRARLQPLQLVHEYRH